VLLVEIVKESTNVTVLAETAPGTPHGAAVRFHVTPPALGACGERRAHTSGQIILRRGAPAESARSRTPSLAYAATSRLEETSGG
jgi:hypothetical protein